MMAYNSHVRDCGLAAWRSFRTNILKPGGYRKPRIDCYSLSIPESIYILVGNSDELPNDKTMTLHVQSTLSSSVRWDDT